MSLRQVVFEENEINGLIPARFKRVAQCLPDHVAIATPSEQISYAELDILSDKISKIVSDFEPGGNQLYALLIDQGITSLAAIFGVLKAGKSYIVFSPDTPLERLKAFWEDAENPTIITNANNLEIALRIAGIGKIINLDTTEQQEKTKVIAAQKTLPEDMAAIFYTSGSSGEPKGVIWSHELVLHTAFLNYQSYQILPNDKIAVLSAYGFGAAMTMSFAALLSGATLFFYPSFQQNPKLLIEWINQNEITILSMTTSGLFRQILKVLQDSTPLEKVRLVVLGGEDLFRADVELFFNLLPSRSILVYRLAGSETMLMREIKIDHSMEFSEDRIPVGYAVQDKELLILSEDQKEIKDGGLGEIAIRSRYLSSGYWRKPELTAKKFIPDKVDPLKKIYLTGDLGRINHKGQLVFGGRKDNMVKIRGFSVQLEVIEKALQELPGIKDAAVKLKSGIKGNRLIAYLIPLGNSKMEIKEMKTTLGKKLPGYSIPSIYCWLEDFPRTQTGKVDRNKLPDTSGDRPELSTKFIDAENETEKVIVSIWKELLGLHQVGINDSFFELGGDSLMVLEMTLEVERAFQVTVPQTFFKDPTVKSLAKLVNSGHEISESEKGHKIGGYNPEILRADFHKRKKPKISRFKRLFTRRYSKKDWEILSGYLERRINSHLIAMRFDDAISWMIRWSNNVIIRNILYHHRRKLFSRWLMTLGGDQDQVPDLFPQNLLTNMFFNMPGPVSKKDKDPATQLNSYRASKHIYWRSLAEIIEKSPANELMQRFPMKNLSYIEEARNLGKGVILLSYHGTPHPGGLMPLSKIMGVDFIPTISYQIPIRKSQYHDQKERISETTAFALNAEIALYGQKVLQEGGIVNFASDTNDFRGRTYKVAIANRQYQIKGGFAEMALNTSALVIPFSRYCLPDGRVEMEFFAPLQPSGGSRDTQVEMMIREYAAFIERSWQTHPAGMSWARIKRHLERPIND